MKKQSTGLLTQISIDQYEYFANIPNETVATDFDPVKDKIFTAAELWNIQRRGKRRIQRRPSF